MSVVELPQSLNMGIWSEALGTIWLPKAFFPTRDDARRWALANQEDTTWHNFRARTDWMVEDPERGESGWYVKCLPEVPGAIECWELW